MSHQPYGVGESVKHVTSTIWCRGKCKTCHINQYVEHPEKIFWGSFSFKRVGLLFPVQTIMKSDRKFSNKELMTADVQKAFSKYFPERFSTRPYFEKSSKFFSWQQPCGFRMAC